MIQFLNRTFTSKTEFESHLRHQVNALPRNSPFTGPDLDLATAILLRRADHKTKIGPGIRTLHARPAPGGRGTELVLTRTDGATLAFSWRKAVTEGSQFEAVSGALRWAMVPQIQRFRDQYFATTAGPVCELSGIRLTAGNSEVDHVEPFWRIRDQFLTQEGGVAAIALDRNVTGVTAVLADEGQLDRWLAFHERVATLRVISAEANRSRGDGQAAMGEVAA